MKHLIAAALLLVGTIFISCTTSDETPGEDQPKGQSITLTTTISLDNGAETRALDASGQKTFEAGDQIAVIYKNTSNETVKATSAAIEGANISTDQKTATFTVTLENPANNGALRYIYPAAMAKTGIDTDAAIDDANTVNYAALASQDGTLATLASNCDLCTYDGDLTADAKLPATANLKNQLAICKFTIKNSGGTDITSSITNLTISDGTDLYVVTRTATEGPIYVAINNGGASAIKLLADFLNSEADGLRIADIDGGSAPNAIATSAKATVVVPNGQKELFTEHFNTYMAEARQQYAQTDPNMTYTVESAQASACMKAAETGLLLKGLSGAPQGVTEWSTEVAGMFETSNNVGVVGMADGICTVNYYARGFNDEKIDGVAVSIEQAYKVGTSPVVSDRYSSYSAWTADLNSSLMQEAREAWKSLFGTEMKLVRVGGGMETSNFAVSYPSMQIFTFGPNVYDAHTINEHVEISSIEHTWKYMLELLKKI